MSRSALPQLKYRSSVSDPIAGSLSASRLRNEIYVQPCDRGPHKRICTHSVRRPRRRGRPIVVVWVVYFTTTYYIHECTRLHLIKR